MEPNSEMPELSTAAEGLLDMLEDDNLRIQRSNSGDIGKEVADLARELQIRELYVRNEMPDLGNGDLGVEILDSETTFPNPAGDYDYDLAAGCSTPHILDLALDMEDDYIMTLPPSPERMPVAPCSSPVSTNGGEDILWQKDSLHPSLFSGDNIFDDEEPEVLKELVNYTSLKMEEDDGGFDPEILKEIVLEKNILEDDGFDPEIVEEVTNVIKGKGDDEISDFVEVVEEIKKHEESDNDDDDGYSNNWPPLPSPMYLPPLSQSLQQRPLLPFQRLPSQAYLNRLPPLPFQRQPIARLQQPSPLNFQQLPPLPIQQPLVRSWYPFKLHQQEPVQNYSK